MSGEKKTIMVPYDGSEPSGRALDFAIDLAKRCGWSLDVVSVLDLREVDFYEGFYLTEDQLDKLETKMREQVLETARAKIPADVPSEVKLLKGPVVRTLFDAVEADHVAMVVLGRQGKNALKRLLEGSVSRALATNAKVPVTVVP